MRHATNQARNGVCRLRKLAVAAMVAATCAGCSGGGGGANETTSGGTATVPKIADADRLILTATNGAGQTSGGGHTATLVITGIGGRTSNATHTLEVGPGGLLREQ